MTSKLFPLSWNIICYPLLNSFTKHLENDRLPQDYITARLKLLPKKDDQKILKNWRPIMVLNANYKLLSSLLKE